MQDDAEVLAKFNGTVRLFPLPNLVLFPHVIQGLHIFEPRYREMMADCVADDLLMALVLLKPNWDKDYDGRPPIEDVACLGRVGPWEKLEDGRYNLRLRGLIRIRIKNETDDYNSYRSAEVDLLPDVVPTSLPVLKSLRQQLAEAVLPRFPDGSQAHHHLGELFHGETPLGPLCDMLSYALPLPLDVKQRLLAEPDVAVRCAVLGDVLTVKAAASGRKFPPEFSAN